MESQRIDSGGRVGSEEAGHRLGLDPNLLLTRWANLAHPVLSLTFEELTCRRYELTGILGLSGLPWWGGCNRGRGPDYM